MLSKEKRRKLFYIFNAVIIVLAIFDLFKVKSLLGDNYIVNDSSFIVGFFQSAPLLSNVFKVVTDLFGTSQFVYTLLTVFTCDIVYLIVLEIPFAIIDFVKGFVK